MTKHQAVCRWGILGTAGIARKNWQAIRHAPNATLVAVASRDLANSQRFIAECQAEVPYLEPPRAFGSYEELLASDAVDAVYIPLPTGVRKEWVIRAAEAGKHVLAEKPAGVCAADVETMVAACRRHNVQFMDGVMFMHSRRLEQIQLAIREGAIGQIKRIATHFTFCASDEFLRDNIRLHSDLEPQGCLGDLGWYNVRFILWLLNRQLPKRVTGRLLTPLRRSDSPRAVPGEFSGELFFEQGISASFYCSFLVENQQWVNIGGTKGYLYMPDFVLPRYGSEAAFQVVNDYFHIAGCESNMEAHERRIAVREYAGGTAESQETFMIRNFANLVLGGKPDWSWADLAWETQKVLDACLASAHADGAVLDLE